LVISKSKSKIKRISNGGWTPIIILAEIKTVRIVLYVKEYKKKEYKIVISDNI